MVAPPTVEVRPLRRTIDRPSIVVWYGTGFVFGLALVMLHPPLVVAALGAGLAGAGGLLLAVKEPRWLVLLLVFLLVGYVAETIGARLGLPNGSYAIALLILAGVVVRCALAVEQYWLPPATAALIALAAVTTLAAAFARDQPASIAVLGDLARNLVVVLVITLLVDRELWLRRAAWTYVLAAGGLASIAVLQQLTESFGSTWLGLVAVTADGANRSMGPLDTVFFGQMLVPAAILALYLFLSGERRTGKVAALSLFLVSLAAIGYTASRGALLAAACALTLTAILQSRRPWIPLAAIALAGLALAPALSEDYRGRLGALAGAVAAGPASLASSEDDSIRFRLGENIAAVQMFVDHPVLGVGPANYPSRYLEYSPGIGLDPRLEEREPHSLVLEALAETGLVGAGVLVAVIGCALSTAWTARNRLAGSTRMLAEGIFVALVGFLVAAVFLQSSYPRYLWTMIGLALATAGLTRASPPGKAVLTWNSSLPARHGRGSSVASRAAWVG